MVPQVVEISLPPAVRWVFAANADADPQDELIAVVQEPAGDAPDTVKIVVTHLRSDGTLERQDVVDLRNRALAYDVAGGLWGVDREGLVELDLAGGGARRIATLPTPLQGLGPTTPSRWTIGQDLDGDGMVELLVPSAGRLHVFRPGGSTLGSIPFSGQGGIGNEGTGGGSSWSATTRLPTLCVADLDGDSRPDLVQPRHASAQVYFTGDRVGARASTLTLPADVDPRRDGARTDGPERNVQASWFEDLDGDRKADFALHRFVTRGGFFGATAEIVLAHGNGAGFGPATTLTTSTAAFGVEPIDFDHDGDLDIVVRLVDVGIANLAKALLQQAVSVQLAAFVATGRSYATKPIPLKELDFPIHPSDRLQGDFDSDVDGDGRLDLVTNDALDRVRVYLGTRSGLATVPAIDLPMPIARGEDTLFAHDLTGDGRAEIVAWGAGERSAKVVRVGS